MTTTEEMIETDMSMIETDMSMIAHPDTIDGHLPIKEGDS